MKRLHPYRQFLCVACCLSFSWNLAEAKQLRPLQASDTFASDNRASQANGSAFGTVKSAEPLSIGKPQTHLPPIVRGSGVEPKQSAGFRTLEPLSPSLSSPQADTNALAPIKSIRHPSIHGQASSIAFDLPEPSGIHQAGGFQDSTNRVVSSGYQTSGLSAAGVPIYPSNQVNVREGRTPSAQSSRFPDAPVISREDMRIPSGYVAGPTTPVYQQASQQRSGIPQAGSVLESDSQGNKSPSYFDAPPAEAPAVNLAPEHCNGCRGGGCSDCGVTDPVGGVMAQGCPSCGPDGCFAQSSIDERLGYFGSMSRAHRYAELDLLYITRSDGDIVLSNFGSVGGYEGDFGWRGTFGRRDDATQGREVSYLGTVDMDETATRIDAPARLNALFGVSGFFAANEASPFFNAIQQDERKSTQLHSVELNQVRWGWDVIKSFYGFRYIYFGDDYRLSSINGVAETGVFNMSADNHLIGAHVGRELFYDVGYRTSFSGVAKFGLYANLNEFEGEVSKDGTVFVSGTDDSATVSTSIDLALNGHHQITRRARFRFGTDLIFLGDILSVSDNIPGVLTPFFGTNSSDRDDAFFYAFHLGLEIYR